MAAIARPVPAPAPARTAAGLVAVALVAAVGIYSSRWGSDFVLFWVFGLVFGLVLQRSRLCFASAFRDLFLFGASPTLRGILVGMAAAAAGFALLESKMVARPGLGVLPPEAHLFPLGWHLVAGGVVFGIGMVLAGGCVSGTLYRMGEGYGASYAAFAGILAGLGLAAHTWNFWWERAIGRGRAIWLPEYLGYGGALLATLGGLAAVWLLLEFREAKGRAALAAAGVPSPIPVSAGPPGVAGLAPAGVAPPGPGGGTALPGSGLAALPASVAVREALRDQLRQLLGALFRRGWPVLVGGLLLGVLNVYVYLAHMPLGLTGELSRWSLKLLETVGWSPGPLLGADQLPGCTLVMGGSSLISHSLMLDAGLVAGSLTSALLAGEFRWRRPPRRRWWQAAGGGVLMGYGAGIAGGCTIGAFFSAIPSLGLNGWVFGLSLLAGAGLGTRLVRRLA